MPGAAAHTPSTEFTQCAAVPVIPVSSQISPSGPLYTCNTLTQKVKSGLPGTSTS